jgi:hypothetical protein
MAALSICSACRFCPFRCSTAAKTIYGFRFGGAAYLTDHSAIPESSIDLLRGLDVLFLDALRYKPHPTHSTVQRSIETVERLAPRRAFFTHLCHDLGHERAESLLPPHIRLAYDGWRFWWRAAERNEDLSQSRRDPADFGPSALTIGNFDGVHTGHRRFCGAVKQIAKERGWTPSALMFDPHPTRIVAPAARAATDDVAPRRAELMAEAKASSRF